MLSKLLQQEKYEDYLNILRDDEDIQNSDAYQVALKPFKISIQKQMWDQLQISIFTTFLRHGTNEHQVMKIFLMHEQFFSSSPLQILQMDKAYLEIKRLNVPDDIQEFHDEFLRGFTRQTIDQLIENISANVDETEEYGQALAEIMKSLKISITANQAPKKNLYSVQDQYLKEFEADFGQYEAFKMAKEALYQKDALGSSDFIKHLQGEIADKLPLQQKFIEMYTSIIKALPDFQKTLSDDQVFQEFSPSQLKNTVSDLFKQLKKQAGSGPQKQAQAEELKQDVMVSRHQDVVPSKIIIDLLREITNEDAKFNEILCQYLMQSNTYSEVVRAARGQIKALKILRQENLEKAFNQITQNVTDLQNIADFMTVNIDINFQALQESLGDWFSQQHELNGKMTTLVLYDLIKKRCDFSKFITHLSKNSNGSSKEILFTQQLFLSYLLNNSDTYLRTMILTTCSNFMPLPLVSYQPNQQMQIAMQLNYHESESGDGNMIAEQELSQDFGAAAQTLLEFTPHVYEELFYCFEKYMGVLAFKVSANPNKSPQGCTSLTNFVFNRTFQTHSKSLVNFGSIDIQFDYNFEHPMFVPVADAHGLVDNDILQCVYPLFNIFMIHTLSGLEHQEVAKTQITKIRQLTENPLIFLIIHDEISKDNNFNLIIDEKIVQITLLGRYNGLLELALQNLRSLILKEFNIYIRASKDYEANISYETNISARLKSLQEFSDFAERFRAIKNNSLDTDEGKIQKAYQQPQDQTQLKKGLDVIRGFMKQIEDNKEHLRSDKVLKMNVLFEEACRLEKKLLRDTSLQRETSEEYRQTVAQRYKEMKESIPSQLTLELKKIIDLQNYLGLTSILSKFIRSFLYLHLKPLLLRREYLRSQYQKLKPDEKVKGEMLQKMVTEKDEMLKEIADISKTVEQRYYSNEFLYREFYISELSQLKGCDKLPSQSFIDYLSLCNLQISQGQPFEIIDGNNLQFIKEVYQRIQDGERQDEQILVVSVIGPQSSGKSLLLNTLFGAQFLSSAGRCTRGVYGCLIDIKSNNVQTHFKKILVLDSEGIQSTEAIDDAFDKRVVFYILCVSHVILICNKGEMNKNMEDTIKLATDCMMQVRNNIDQPPKVNVIMNNVQINEGSLFQTIQSLSDCLLEMKSPEGKKQIFTIDKSNVFLLPNAFAQSGNQGFVAYQPSYQFAERVDELRQSILDVVKGGVDITFYTLESWFKQAQAFWEFTDGYSELINYTTLEEKKEDIILGEFSKTLISKYFEDEKINEQHVKMINDEVEVVLGKHKGFDQTTINSIKLEIDHALHPGQQQVEFNIYEEFRKFTDSKGIRPLIKKRREDQLLTQMKQHFLIWQQIVQQLLGEFNDKKSRFIGDKSLNNAINGYIQDDQKQYSKDEAGLLFKKEWGEIVILLAKSLKQAKIISEEQFRDIGQSLYRQNFRKMVKVEEDRTLLTEYEKDGYKIIFNHLVSMQGFFQFDSKTFKQQGQEFKKLIERKKIYVNNKNLQFFDEYNAQRYYNWRKIVEERFNFSALSDAFKQSYKFILLKLGIPWIGKQQITEKYIEQVIAEIQHEANYFNIDITQEFADQMYLLGEITQKKGHKEDAIKKQVHQIQQNIQKYFQYKNRDNDRAPTSYKYFQIKAFSRENYTETLEPQDERILKGGLESLDKQQIHFTINNNIMNDDKNFYRYLKFLVRSDESPFSSQSPEVKAAVSKFYSLVDHEKVLKTIQENVLEKIFRNKDNKYKTVEKLVQDLIESENPLISKQFCAMDFKVAQRIATCIEQIEENINEDMEPYWLRVSVHGRDCLHQIAQTYIVRIMQEVIRLTEHAPLYNLKNQEIIQRDLFIAKLTSNDSQMDQNLAVRTRTCLVPLIIEELKEEETKLFQVKIGAEKELFQLKKIVSNIENQVVQIADGIIPDQFQIEENQVGEGESWLQTLIKIKNAISSFLGYEQTENEEEEKKQQFISKMQRFKKLDQEFEFTPEEIIMFYVQPSDFLQKKFQDQWKKSTDQDIKKAKLNYSLKINKIKQNFLQYFEIFLNQIQEKKIQLSTDVFFPESQDLVSHQYLSSPLFRGHSQKAMAVYMGLVLTKQWKDFKVIQLDDNQKMIHRENISLVTHENIDFDIAPRYAAIIQDCIQKHQISNIQKFIKDLMNEFNTHLDPDLPENSLDEIHLIKDLYKDMLYKTLGCSKTCPLCKRQCDQPHDLERPEDQIHCCDSGHQIQGFGGNVHKKDNKAITFGCHELNNNDQVNWKGSDMKWQKFKEVVYNDHKWNLEDKQGAKELIKQKNVKIWNKIGPFICDYYQLLQNINIKFVEADASANNNRLLQRVLYVLMLDNSSSMSEQDKKSGQSRWQTLSSAVSSFIGKFDSSLQTHSSVSIITYNSSAKLEVDAKVPSQAILRALTGPGGGTNFNPPLQMAKQQMEKYESFYDSFVLFMMSDGEASYPSEGVESIKKSPAYSKLKFKSIAYGDGSDSESLKQMAKQLGGTSETVLDTGQLSNAFIMMIPNPVVFGK